MTDDKLNEIILKNAISLQTIRINELAWERQNAIALIITLMDENIGILGGDVYVVNEDNRITPSSESWSCIAQEDESVNGFNYRSKTEALAYLNAFPSVLDEKLLFSLLFC